jgi:hypothetical protein
LLHSPLGFDQGAFANPANREDDAGRDDSQDSQKSGVPRFVQWIERLPAPAAVLLHHQVRIIAFISEFVFHFMVGDTVQFSSSLRMFFSLLFGNIRDA